MKCYSLNVLYNPYSSVSMHRFDNVCHKSINSTLFFLVTGDEKRRKINKVSM